MGDLSEHDVSKISVQGFDISEEVWHAGVLQSHVHANAHLAIIFEGEVGETTDTDRRTIGRGSCAFFPAGIRHELEFREKTSFISIDLSPERASMTRDLFGDAPAYPLVPSREILPLAARLRDEFHRLDRGHRVALEGIALELIAQCSRIFESGQLAIPPRIREAKRVIDDNHMNNVGLSKIAEQVGISPVRLAEGFRKAFKCTVGQYIRRKRVEHAIELLVNSPMKLGDIAHETGFCDQPHLVRVFKQLTGTTPARYRCSSVYASNEPGTHRFAVPDSVEQ